MTNLIHGILLALHLIAADSSTVAERACAYEWVPASLHHDSAAYEACVVGLESWRCEVQGWCSAPSWAGSTLRVMPLPDAIRAVAVGCE